jgi:hypothetical protein
MVVTGRSAEDVRALKLLSWSVSHAPSAAVSGR